MLIFMLLIYGNDDNTGFATAHGSSRPPTSSSPPPPPPPPSLDSINAVNAIFSDQNIADMLLPPQTAMNNRPPARRVGQNQFTVKRHKVAHPMERVLDDIRKQGFDRQRSEDRHRRYQELLQFQQQPGHSRKV